MSKRSAQSGSAGMSARQRQDMRASELLEQAQNKETQTVVFMDISIDGDPAGRIEFELYKRKTPITAENFRSLCMGEKGEKFCYRNTKFHRVIKGFICQGGDVENKNGLGGRSIYNFHNNKSTSTFADEVDFDSSTEKDENVHHEGSLSMSNNGPHTNRSQFFICVGEAHQVDFLNDRHVVFGKVKKGMDVVRFINTKGTKSGMPMADIRVTDCGQLS